MNYSCVHGFTYCSVCSRSTEKRNYFSLYQSPNIVILPTSNDSGPPAKKSKIGTNLINNTKNISQNITTEHYIKELQQKTKLSDINDTNKDSLQYSVQKSNNLHFHNEASSSYLIDTDNKKKVNRNQSSNSSIICSPIENNTTINKRVKQLLSSIPFKKCNTQNKRHMHAHSKNEKTIANNNITRNNIKLKSKPKKKQAISSTDNSCDSHSTNTLIDKNKLQNVTTKKDSSYLKCKSCNMVFNRSLQTPSNDPRKEKFPQKNMKQTNRDKKDEEDKAPETSIINPTNSKNITSPTSIKSVVKITENYDFNLNLPHNINNNVCNKQDLRIKLCNNRMRSNKRDNLVVTLPNTNTKPETPTINIIEQAKPNIKTVKIVINLICQKSKGSEQQQDSGNDVQSTLDISFLDDINVDDIVECLNDGENIIDSATTNKTDSSLNTKTESMLNAPEIKQDYINEVKTEENNYFGRSHQALGNLNNIKNHNIKRDNYDENKEESKNKDEVNSIIEIVCTERQKFDLKPWIEVVNKNICMSEDSGTIVINKISNLRKPDFSKNCNESDGNTVLTNPCVYDIVDVSDNEKSKKSWNKTSTEVNKDTNSSTGSNKSLDNTCEKSVIFDDSDNITTEKVNKYHVNSNTVLSKDNETNIEKSCIAEISTFKYQNMSNETESCVLTQNRSNKDVMMSYTDGGIGLVALNTAEESNETTDNKNVKPGESKSVGNSTMIKELPHTINKELLNVSIDDDTSKLTESKGDTNLVPNKSSEKGETKINNIESLNIRHSNNSNVSPLTMENRDGEKECTKLMFDVKKEIIEGTEIIKANHVSNYNSNENITHQQNEKKLTTIPKQNVKPIPHIDSVLNVKVEDTSLQSNDKCLPDAISKDMTTQTCTQKPSRVKEVAKCTLKKDGANNAARLLNKNTTESFYITLKNQLQIKIYNSLKEKYDVGAMIHRGKYSYIFKSTDTKGNEYAVKALRKDYDYCKSKIQKQKTFVLRNIQKDIPKDNLNSVFIFHAFGIKLGLWCYLMEYYPHNLNQVLKARGKGFAINDVQRLSIQLVSAITVLRNNSIVHSDIHPKHILLNSKLDKLKLCGFDEMHYNNHNFYANTDCRTLCYGPPEVILGLVASFGIDVWAAGLVMYEMYTCHQLFTGASGNAILFKQIETLGIFPQNMIYSSPYKDYHFFGRHFVKRYGINGEKYSIFNQYSLYNNNKLYNWISRTYLKNWGKSKTRPEKDKDMEKIRMFYTLLQKMLVIHPNERIPIEFVFADEFIFGQHY